MKNNTGFWINIVFAAINLPVFLFGMLEQLVYPQPYWWCWFLVLIPVGLNLWMAIRCVRKHWDGKVPVILGLCCGLVLAGIISAICGFFAAKAELSHLVPLETAAFYNLFSVIIR